MDKMLLLKGKLEMAKRTIQLQKQKNLGKKPEHANFASKTLVYKDVEEGDDSSENEGKHPGQDDNDEMASSDDERNQVDSQESVDGDSESEEEIKEIPLKKLAAKRARKGTSSNPDPLDSSDDEDDG